MPLVHILHILANGRLSAEAVVLKKFLHGADGALASLRADHLLSLLRRVAAPCELRCHGSTATQLVVFAIYAAFLP